MHNQVVLILSALEEMERQVLRQYLFNEIIQKHPDSNTDYYVGSLATNIGDIRVILGRTDQTNVSAALETDRALSYFKPHYAFFVGVAGGLKDVSVGDVVIGKDVFGYERGKTTAEGFKARPGAGNSSYTLERAATNLVHSEVWKSLAKTLPIANFKTPIKVLTGTIASGEKVDADVDSDLHKFLHSHFNHALAVEMEGFGFLEACRQHPHTQALVIRGISDLVNDKSGSDKLGSQPYASANAAAFTFTLVKQLFSNEIIEHLPSEGDAKLLIKIASDLYPGGIRDISIWERSGGRVSDIAVNTNGRSQWQDAIRHIRNGGRGATYSKLVLEMLEDFPDHTELIFLRG